MDFILAILFVIHITIVVHGLHFEILTLASEIHGHMNLNIGITNLFGIGADQNIGKSNITFLNDVSYWGSQIKA